MAFYQVFIFALCMHLVCGQQTPQQCPVNDTNCKLDFLLVEVSWIKKEVSWIKKEVSWIKKEVSWIKKEVSWIKKEVSGIKKEVSETKSAIFMSPYIKNKLGDAVVTDTGHYRSCRINLLEYESRIYFLTSLHCYLVSHSTSNGEFYYVEMKALSNDKHPPGLFGDLKDAKVDITRDILLVEIDSTSNYLSQANLTPFKISSVVGSCDPASVDRVICCCSNKCLERFKMDVISISPDSDPEYLRTSHSFIKGESGCICVDSLTQFNHNDCIFINSHQHQLYTIPNVYDFKRMEICMKNAELLQILQVETGCDSVMNQYHQRIKDGIVNVRTMVSILDPHKINNMVPINFVLQKPWNSQNIDTAQIKLYPIPTNHHQLVKDSKIYHLMLREMED